MDDNTGTENSVGEALVPEVIRHAVRMVAPVTVENVTGTDRLIGDLGFHSLALAELAFVLEDLFQLDPITPEQAMSIDQVSDIEQLIATALKEGIAEVPTLALIESNSSQYGTQWRPRV
jgi:acyl carrier protein